MLSMPVNQRYTRNIPYSIYIISSSPILAEDQIIAVGGTSRRDSAVHLRYLDWSLLKY